MLAITWSWFVRQPILNRYVILFLMMGGIIGVGTDARVGSAQAGTPPGVGVIYDVYFGGLRMAEAEGVFALDDSSYTMNLDAQMRGITGMITQWRASMTAQGQVNGRSVEPAQHRYHQQRRRGSEMTEMRFGSDGVPDATRRPAPSRIPKEGDPDYIPRADLVGAVDPASGVVTLLRTLGTTNTCRDRVPLYDGSRRFDAVVEPIGRETLSASRYSNFSGEAIRCRVTLEFISGDFKAPDSDQFWARDSAPSDRQMDMWLGQPVTGGPHVPVRMQGDTRYGRFVIHLRDARPMGQ